MKKVLALLTALVLVFALTAVAENEVVNVKVGVVGSTNEQWSEVLVPELAKEGIEIELIYFNDYVMPNIALATGDVDLNAFQHYNFLNNWNDENAETYGKKLAAIGETLIAPLSLYSDKYTSVDQFQKGDTILVMNDVVNEARALQMLEALGLIKLAENLTSYATVIDIVENPLELNLIELDAAMIGSQMSDTSVAAGFMNGQYATQAGYAHESAIAVEAYDPNNADQHGIVNIIAAREEDLANPVYLRIAEAYQCDAVAEVFNTLYKGSFVPAWSTEAAAE
ncbi:MAG: MetQ/NlpA family ABC transporter substrate-binding protein [Clostridia bacterium]|nr:MetQ/NlpA family ABC transporter substrate-binding protein [Clostridia bacterium]